MSPRNVAREDNFFHDMGMKIVTGSCYIVGFVGDRVADDICIAEKVQVWKESVKTLLGFIRKHTQSTYVGLQKSLQY